MAAVTVDGTKVRPLCNNCSCAVEDHYFELYEETTNTVKPVMFINISRPHINVSL